MDPLGKVFVIDTNWVKDKSCIIDLSVLDVQIWHVFLTLDCMRDTME